MGDPFQKLLQKEIQSFAKPETKIQYERYFKGVLSFYGLKAPEVQQVFQKIWPRFQDSSLERQKEIAFELLASQYGEEKHLALLILNKITGKIPPAEFLNELEPMIDRFVYDWGTADGLAGRVLRFLIPKDPKTTQALVVWKDAPNLWRQRIAAVSFVNHARHGKYNEEILTICSTIIRNPERFVQLGAGWVVRELFLADPKAVKDFIRKNYEYFSREGLRYAIEKMNPEERSYFLSGKF